MVKPMSGGAFPARTSHVRLGCTPGTRRLYSRGRSGTTADGTSPHRGVQARGSPKEEPMKRILTPLVLLALAGSLAFSGCAKKTETGGTTTDSTLSLGDLPQENSPAP